MLKIKKKEECSIPESVWREYVLEMLERHKTRGYTFRDFIKSLGVKSQEGKSRLRKTLMVLKDLGEINEVRQGTFQYKREGIYTTGVVELNRSGSAYIRSREFKEKIFCTFYRFEACFEWGYRKSTGVCRWYSRDVERESGGDYS